MKKQILIIEDDPNLGFVIQEFLKEKGYETSLCQNGKEGKEKFLIEKPDLCLLDVMLPEIDGFMLAKEIRQHDTETPILFLTARDMVEDRIKGFKSGGDDYITKPFSIEELSHRIEVFLSRSSKNLKDSSDSLYEYADVKIDYLKNLLQNKNQHIELTDKELQIIRLFINHKERVLKREEILIEIWGDDDYFMGRSLDVFISKLRKYLKDSKVSIKNYHGIGFKWEES